MDRPHSPTQIRLLANLHLAARTPTSSKSHAYILPFRRLHPALHERQLHIPAPRELPLAERGVERLAHGADEHELHLVADLGGDVVLDVLAVCAGEDDARDACAVSTEDFLLDPANGRDAAAEGDLGALST